MHLLAYLIGSAHAQCEGPIDNSTVTASLDAAERSYETLDLERFRAEVDDAVNGFTCLQEKLTVDNALRLHQMAGLKAFIDKDRLLAEQNFAAARVVDPARALPERLVPTGNPLQMHYAAIDLSKVRPEVLPMPAEGALILDGSRTQNRRTALPVFYQRELNGGIKEGRLLPPGASVPDYEALVERKGLKPQVPMLIGAAALLATSVVIEATVYGQARDMKGNEGMFRSDQIRKVKSTATVATVVGGAGLGLGVAGVFVAVF